MKTSYSPIEAVMERRFNQLYNKLEGNPNRINILKASLVESFSQDLQKIKKENGLSSLPVNPFKVKKILGINIKYVFTPRKEISSDGTLVVENNEIIIKLDENLQLNRNKNRMRTTAAHELMHILFYDFKNIPIKKYGRGITQRKYYFIEEEMCNYLAREFLLPNESILEFIENNNSYENPSLNNIDTIKSRYLVSSDVVGYKMIKDLNLWNCMYAKYLQKSLDFTPSILLKYSDNPLYQKMSFPRHIPSLRNKWQKIFSEYFQNTIEKKEFEKEIHIYESNIKFESRVESHFPLGLIFLITKL